MPNRQIVGGEPYRYAYQGQEKDPETGKEAFQLRLWDSRIGRWLTTDPYRQFSSPYLGMGNNPMRLVDPDGGFAYPETIGNILFTIEALISIHTGIGLLDDVVVSGISRETFWKGMKTK